MSTYLNPISERDERHPVLLLPPVGHDAAVPRVAVGAVGVAVPAVPDAVPVVPVAPVVPVGHHVAVGVHQARGDQGAVPRWPVDAKTTEILIPKIFL